MIITALTLVVQHYFIAFVDNINIVMRQKMIKYYFAAQDIHERINSSHLIISNYQSQLKNTDLISYQRLLELQARYCREIAHSLQYNKSIRTILVWNKRFFEVSSRLKYIIKQSLKSITTTCPLKH